MNDVITNGGGGDAGLDQKMTSDDMMTWEGGLRDKIPSFY